MTSLYSKSDFCFRGKVKHTGTFIKILADGEGFQLMVIKAPNFAPFVGPGSTIAVSGERVFVHRVDIEAEVIAIDITPHQKAAMGIDDIAPTTVTLEKRVSEGKKGKIRGVSHTVADFLERHDWRNSTWYDFRLEKLFLDLVDPGDKIVIDGIRVKIIAVDRKKEFFRVESGAELLSWKLPGRGKEVRKLRPSVRVEIIRSFLKDEKKLGVLNKIEKNLDEAARKELSSYTLD